LNVGQSKFRCDLAVRGRADDMYRLGILVDTDGHYANPSVLDRYLMQPSILKAFGWRFALVLTKDWYHNPDDVLARLEKLLQGQDSEPEAEPPEREPLDEVAPLTPESTVSRATTRAPRKAEAGESAKDSVDPTPVPVPASAPGPARHFEFVGGSSSKFWVISTSGNSLTVRFGRIGTAGQSQTKTFADEAKAQREANKMIAEKLKKGYVEKPT